MELRLVLTVDDFDRALALYRDALGLEEMQVWEDGRVVLLDAGRATLELADEAHAATVDELEVGRRVAGKIRVAFQVEDAEGVAQRLEQAGAVRIAGPIETPWHDLNVRLDAPDGLQLTLFQPL